MADQTYSKEQTVAPGEAALKRMLAMPPKPHKALRKNDRDGLQRRTEDN
jgi:hypothetical protein